MKRVYPAIFTKDKEWYIVELPDFDITTQGNGLADAMDMARDALNLMGMQFQDEGKKLPESSDMKQIKTYAEQFCTLIDCDFEEYRKALDNRAVKKNCTLPSWLNKKAEAANINFSAVLQEALIDKLGV